MADNDITALEAFAGELIASMEHGARKALAAELAKALRQRQQQRIAAQQNPDGSPYTPRKPQQRHKKGRIRRTMFAKLRTARFLKAIGTPGEAIVRFTDSGSRIGRVHQFGLRDYVNRRTGLEIDYPQRELLGFSDSDLDLVREIIVDHLARVGGRV